MSHILLIGAFIKTNLILSGRREKLFSCDKLCGSQSHIWREHLVVYRTSYLQCEKKTPLNSRGAV